MTGLERLRFAVELANTDLERFRAGDWLNCREELGEFLLAKAGAAASFQDLGGILAQPIEPPFPHDFPEEAFRVLQTDVRDVLRATALGVRAVNQRGASLRALKTKAVPTLKLAVLPLPTHGQISASGSVRDTFLLILFFLLAQRPRIIRECPEPNCRTLFVKQGKQKYCARLCASRASVRDYDRRQRKASQEPAQKKLTKS